MKKNKQILWTCVISIVVLCMIYFFLSTRTGEARTVYLMAEDAEAGSLLDPEKLLPVTVRTDVILPNAVSEAGMAAGKTLLRDMKKGDILAAHDVGDPLTGILYPDLADGMELYSLSVKPEEANGWWLYEGNRINLYLILPEELQSGPDSEESELLPDACGSAMRMGGVRIMRILSGSGGPVSAGDSDRILCLELKTDQIGILEKTEKGGIIRISACNEAPEPHPAGSQEERSS